jgi:hypothetical protein
MAGGNSPSHHLNRIPPAPFSDDADSHAPLSHLTISGCLHRVEQDPSLKLQSYRRDTILFVVQ